MKRLEQTFLGLRERNEAAFMPFLVVGDPTAAISRRLATALIHAGADILEFGFAFSDPPADGPVIQLADQRALAAGMTTRKAFDFLLDLRKETEIPFTLLVYYNLVLQYGVEAFYRRAAEVGIDAVLVADLPLEEAKDALAAAETYGVAPIFVISELTSTERLARILPAARGYLYLVTHVGVTGERTDAAARIGETIARVRSSGSKLPLLAGFGISSPSHVTRYREAGADGAIVGSAIIRSIETHLDDPDAMLREVTSLGRALKSATR